MHLALNNHVFQYLRVEGYRYCLSKTVFINTGPVSICIILKPSRYNSQKPGLEAPGTSMIQVMQDALKFADNNSDTLVVVQLRHRALTRYMCYRKNSEGRELLLKKELRHST